MKNAMSIKMFAIVASVIIACALCFSSACLPFTSHALAYATQGDELNIESTMTVQMKDNSNAQATYTAGTASDSSADSANQTAQTGDQLCLLALAILALVGGVAYVFFASRRTFEAGSASHKRAGSVAKTNIASHANASTNASAGANAGAQIGSRKGAHADSHANASTGANSRIASHTNAITNTKRTTRNKAIAVLLASLLVSSMFFTGFATAGKAQAVNTSAQATTTDQTSTTTSQNADPTDKITVDSTVTIDDAGNVESATIQVSNNSGATYVVKDIEAPEIFSGWTDDISADYKIAPGTTEEGEWNGETVPDEVLKQVLVSESNSVEYKFNTVVQETAPISVANDAGQDSQANEITATFVANAPAGLEATVDGNSTSEKTLAVDANAGAHTFASADFPTSVKITSDNPDGYYFAGWAQSADAAYGTKSDQMIGTAISGSQTYYAIWLKPTGYWLGSAGAGTEYTDEAYFAANDPNFHSSAEISADMKVLHDSTNADYQKVKAKWDAYYANADSEKAGVGNKIRLYATYSGGENETEYEGTKSELNKYVEFRILEVSGAEGHKIDSTQSDESAVTFMATHMLPTAYAMNDDDDHNTNGWDATRLKARMSSGGEIYNKFSSDLRGAVKTVTKKYCVGTVSTTTKTCSCQFWVIAASELCSTATSEEECQVNEGEQYAWGRDVGINNNNNQACLAKWTTRGGAVPGGAARSDVFWWERTTWLGHDASFLLVNKKGNMYIDGPAGQRYGVVPCFCL